MRQALAFVAARPHLLLPAALAALFSTFVNPFGIIKDYGLLVAAGALLAVETSAHAAFAAAADPGLRSPAKLTGLFALLGLPMALAMLLGPAAPLVGAVLFVVAALGLPALRAGTLAQAVSAAGRRAKAAPLTVVARTALIIVLPILGMWLSQLYWRTYPAHMEIPRAANLFSLWLAAAFRFSSVQICALATSLREV